MTKYILTILGGVVLLGAILADAQTQVDNISVSKLTEKFDASQIIKSKYQLDGASLIREAKSDPKDRIVVEIGDKNLQEFTPEIKLSRWDEVNFKLKPKGLESVATKDKDLKFEGEKIKFDTPKISFEMYDFTEGEGGYKFIWYLNEKPITNKVEFQIESEGLDFFYQPELTPEEITQGASRPENVTGSYAVYHSTKGGMNDINGKEYKAGKAFHIYRPHIIDANGAETWGILHIENGIYSVEIPQEFLDTAQFPVRSNDTFGFGSIGGTEYGNFGNSGYFSNLYTSGGSGTVSKISFYSYTDSSSKTQATAIYRYSDKVKIANSSESAYPTSYAWTDTTISASITAVAYYLSWWGSFNNSFTKYDSATDFKWGLDITNNYATGWPSTINDTGVWPPSDFYTGVSGRKYSIYATYTPSGGGETATSSATASFLGNVNFLGNIIIK